MSVRKGVKYFSGSNDGKHGDMAFVQSAQSPKSAQPLGFPISSQSHNSQLQTPTRRPELQLESQWEWWAVSGGWQVESADVFMALTLTE